MKKLLASYAAVSICSWTLAFLMPLYVLEITGSASWTALTYCAAMAPYILVTPFAGVWSDRYEKRKFLIGTDIASVLAAMIVYFSLGALHGNTLIWTLVFMSFVLASIAATHHPMFQGIAPKISPAEELKLFNSITNAQDNIIRIAAPIAAALLLTVFPKKLVLLGCCGGFLLSIPMLLTLQVEEKRSEMKLGVLKEMGEGFRFVLSDSNLIFFSVLFLFVNAGLSLIGSNLIYIFVDIFLVPQNMLGYYYSIIACGALTGSFLAPRLIGKLPDALLIIVCCIFSGVFSLLAAASTSALQFSVIWGMSTCCTSVVVVTFFTFRQKVVPQRILGRAVGVTRLISYLAIPPASIMGGVIMERTHSVVLIMLMGGTAIILGAIAVMLSPAVRNSGITKMGKTNQNL